MARLTEEKINEIRRLYSEVGIFSQVAKQVGCSPATVKKYVSDGIPATNKKVINKFSETVQSIEEMDLSIFKTNRLELARLSKEEYSEIEKLWEELA